jgi:hypothetical protein
MVEKCSKNKDKSKKCSSKKNKSLSTVSKSKNKSKKKISIKCKKVDQKGGGELVDNRDWKQRTLDSIKLLDNSDKLTAKPSEKFGKFPYPDCTIS